MCPFCLATVGMIVAGAASTGGLAALAIKVSRQKNEATKLDSNSNQTREEK